MADKLTKTVVGTKELAELFNLSDRRIRQMAQTRELQWINDDPYQFYLGEAVLSYVESLRRKLGQRDASSDEVLQNRKLVAEVEAKEEDAVHRKIKKEMAQLQLDEYKGRLHRAEDVSEMMTAMVMAARQGILSFHGRLAIPVAEESDPAVTSELIQQVEEEVLNALAKHEYNPNFFKDKTHERMDEDLEDIENAAKEPD